MVDESEAGLPRLPCRVKGNMMRRDTVRRTALGIIAGGSAVLALVVSGMPGQLFQAVGALGRLRPDAVMLALALTVIAMLINGSIWSWLIMRMGFQVPRRLGLTAFLGAGLAGLLVNAAGPAVGCAMSVRRHGICPARAVLLAMLGNALGFCGVLIWAPVGLVLLAREGMDSALPLLGQHSHTVVAVALFGLSVAMLAVLQALTLAPGLSNGLGRRLLGRHTEAVSGMPLRFRHLLALIPWAAGAWFVTTLSLYVFLNAVSPDADLNLGDVIGSAALAGTLGSLAFFVPDGMGVRDGALVALLSHSTGIPVAQCTAAAIAMRALDPVSKVGMLALLTISADLTAPRPVTRGRAWLCARWSQRPGHIGLRLPWYLWQAAFAERN